MKLYNSFLVYIGANRFLFIGGVLCIVLVSVTTIAPIYLFKSMVGLFQRVSSVDSIGAVDGLMVVYREEFIWLILLSVVLVGIMVIFTFLQNYLMGLFGKKVLFRLRNDIYKKVLELPISYSHYQRKKTTISLMGSDLLLIERFTVDKVINLIKEPLVIIGSLVTMVYMSIYLTVTVFLLAPLLFYAVYKISNMVRGVEVGIRDDFSYLLSLISETLRNLKLIKMFASEGKEESKFMDASRAFLDKEKRLIFYESLNRPAIELIGAICLVIILFMGGYGVINGKLSMDRFTAFIVALFTLSSPIRELSRVLVLIKQTSISFRRVFSFLDIGIESLPSVIRPRFISLKRDICFNNVSFGFGDGSLVLDGVSITIERGTHIAIVGESGVGKSSIIGLLTLLYSVTSGGIYFDGININSLDPVSLRERVSIVPQEDFFFNVSIRDNILYSSSGASYTDIIESTKLANAYDFIMALPDGFDTIVGEGGFNLSGGERQRISLARALIRRPELLILDEATKSLDSCSERMIQNTITNRLKGQTTIIIAHQFSNIIHADKIIVLKGGKVIESGNHNELINFNGEYKKLYDLQLY